MTLTKHISKMAFALMAIFSMVSLKSSAASGALNFVRDSASFIDVAILMNGGHSYTKEAWINANANTTHNIISGGDDPFWLHNGHLRAANRWQGTPTVVEDSATFPLNVWVHVAVTFDSATATMRLYKNGEQVAVATNANTYLTSFEQVGAYNDGNVFDGMMDEVRVWGRALCRPEIAMHMNSGVQGTEQDLLVYYKFDDGLPLLGNLGITTIADASGHGKKGTLKHFSLLGSITNFVTGVVLNTSYVAFTPPTATVSSQTTSFGATLTANAAASYQWMRDGAWLTGVTNQSYDAEPGNYSVMITASNGCTNISSTVSVADPNPLGGTISTSPSVPVTGQDPNTIYTGYGTDSVTVSATGSGGTPPYSYEWTCSEQNTTGNASKWGSSHYRCGGGSYTCNNKSPKVKPSCTSTFKCKITDAKGRCKTVTQTINVKNIQYGSNVLLCHESQTCAYSCNWSCWHTKNVTKYQTYSVPSSWVPLFLYLGDHLGDCGDAKGINSSSEIVNVGTMEFKTFPNPTTDMFTITLPEPGNAQVVITDITGRVINQLDLKNQVDQNIKIDLTNANPGMYLVHVSNNDKSYSSKIMKQ